MDSAPRPHSSSFTRPILSDRIPAGVAVREPYVVAAHVYAAPGHVGVRRQLI